MANIIITHSGSQTIIDSNGTSIEFATADATVTATSDTRISIVVDDEEVLECSIYDIVSIDSAKPYGNAGDVVTQITNESVSPSSSYLVYTALLTQSGTDAPVATVLANTLGGAVVWSYTNVGEYDATLVGAFPSFYVSGFGDFAGAGQPLMPIWGVGEVAGYYTIYKTGGDSFRLQVFDNTMTAAEFSTILGATTLCLPEIRVYP